MRNKDNIVINDSLQSMFFLIFPVIFILTLCLSFKYIVQLQIKCTQYWPNGNKARLFGTLSVKMTEEKEYAFFIKRTLSVSHLTVRMVWFEDDLLILIIE